jgi:chromosome segregation ATPase
MPRMNRVRARSLGLLGLLTLLLAAAPASAQEDPELAGFGGGDLLEVPPKGRKAAEAAPEDPHPALLAEVEEKRAAFEGTLNRLATAANRFAEIDKEVNSLTSQGIKAMDDYSDTHSKALERLHEASAGDDAKLKKKLSEDVAGVRKKYLTAIAKVQKGADKLKEKADKLQAKIDSGKAVLDEGKD